jgi:hypothetical protein
LFNETIFNSQLFKLITLTIPSTVSSPSKLQTEALEKYLLQSLVPPDCYRHISRKTEASYLSLFGLDNADGRKRVYNRRFRLKELIAQRYPKFVKLCEFHKVVCPEDNNWAYHAYPKIKTPEKSQIKTPEKSPNISSVTMPKFKTNSNLLKNGGVGDDDDYGTCHV